MLDLLFFLQHSLSSINSEQVQIFSNFAVIGAFIASIVIFYYTFKQNKKSEELKTMHEVLKYFTDAENELLKAANEFDKNKDKSAYEIKLLMYFNVWEWVAFLLKTKIISDENGELDLIGYLQPTLIKDYETFKIHPFLTVIKKALNDPKEFTETKKLYKKWKEQIKD